MTELKPCPFCGGEAKEISKSGFLVGFVCIYCTNCEAQSGSAAISKDYCATDKAAEAWNNRVEPEAKALTAEDLKQMNGLPVWFECLRNKTHKGWFICGEYEWRQGHTTDWITINGLRVFPIEDYGLEFICYDREPKED